MAEKYVGNAEQLAFLADACKALDEVRENNNEAKSFIYLGRVEVKIDAEVIGWLEDADGIGYSYWQNVDPEDAS